MVSDTVSIYALLTTNQWIVVYALAGVVLFPAYLYVFKGERDRVPASIFFAFLTPLFLFGVVSVIEGLLWLWQN